MIEVFDFNDILLSGSVFENRHTMNRRLIANIIKLSNLYSFKKIKTNANIVSFLSDINGYYMNPINTNIINNQNLIQYGIIANFIDIYLDSNQNWDDNKIYPIYDPLLIRTYKINKIKGNNLSMNILDYLELKNCDLI